MQQPPLMAAPLRACSSRHPRGTMARWVANIAITPPSPGPATSARVPPATAKPGPRRVGQGQADAARQLRFRLPRGPKRWNPEELLVAGLSQCHMLWILHLRGVNGIVVTSCTDDDQDTMAEGGGEFATVTLRSRAAITDSGKANRSLELHEEPTGSALSPARSTSPSAASRSSPDHQTRLTPGPCESAWYCRRQFPRAERVHGSMDLPCSRSRPATFRLRSPCDSAPNIQLRIGSYCRHQTAARV